MNYYLVECDYPTVKLRHYKNSRVANYTLEQLNMTAGFVKYKIISDDEPVITMSVKRSFNVDPFAPAEQVLGRLS
ncbi:hypothetical protein UFOVP447_116 [uncultured Caudovirales phage]|uniref:Uncharacterized protein n=1 Tax=uncultured Caudovirales phage TaxID=2100421 RepID=A0A6J5ME21_9CAUD|nr:hypothetical protein UFOVP447_116 [uncultured Caudovirales phage]